MENQQLKVKSKVSMQEAIKHLENIVVSLKEGRLSIKKNDDIVTLTPHEPVSFELNAEVKLGKNSLKEKLSIELKWKKGEQVMTQGDTFTITHDDPELKS